MLTTDRKLTFLGFQPTGDLAGLTCYTSRRRRIVWFVKSPPTSPPSVAQRLNRARFTAAAQAWKATPTAKRDLWHLASRRGGLCMHGYNLWVHWQIIRDAGTIHTIERQTRTKLI